MVISGIVKLIMAILSETNDMVPTAKAALHASFILHFFWLSLSYHGVPNTRLVGDINSHEVLPASDNLARL